MEEHISSSTNGRHQDITMDHGNADQSLYQDVNRPSTDSAPDPRHRRSHDNSPDLNISSTQDASSTTNAEPGASDISQKGMSRNQKLTVLTFCFANFCVGIFYALLGPFFPNEAVKMGANSTVTGLIFGVFELVVVLTSPIFGNYMVQIGPKFMFCSGVMVCGASAVLFGFVDRAPPGTVYIVLCFLVRVFEGLGAAAFSTASFSIMAHTFPDRVATMFGSLEMFTGLGLMVGPPIGGALFQWGGFMLPFVSSGVLLAAIGFLSIFFLPSQADGIPSSGAFILSLLKIPIVSIIGLLLIAGSGAIGFTDVALSLFLEDKFHFSPLILGLIFLVGSGAYALSAPVWGFFADKYPRFSQPMIAFGFMSGGFLLFFLGPAPFFNIPTMLWLVLVSLGAMGLGLGTLVVAFQVLTEAAREEGYPDTLETYGLISGIFNCFFSLGAFIGPLAGGYLNDTLHFELASAVVGAVNVLAGLVLCLYILVQFCRRKRTSRANISRDLESETTERTPLLRGASQ